MRASSTTNNDIASPSPVFDTLARGNSTSLARLRSSDVLTDRTSLRILMTLTKDRLTVFNRVLDFLDNTELRDRLIILLDCDVLLDFVKYESALTSAHDRINSLIYRSTLEYAIPMPFFQEFTHHIYPLLGIPAKKSFHQHKDSLLSDFGKAIGLEIQSPESPMPTERITALLDQYTLHAARMRDLFCSKRFLGIVDRFDDATSEKIYKILSLLRPQATHNNRRDADGLAIAMASPKLSVDDSSLGSVPNETAISYLLVTRTGKLLDCSKKIADESYGKLCAVHVENLYAEFMRGDLNNRMDEFRSLKSVYDQLLDFLREQLRRINAMRPADSPTVSQLDSSRGRFDAICQVFRSRMSQSSHEIDAALQSSVAANESHLLQYCQTSDASAICAKIENFVKVLETVFDKIDTLVPDDYYDVVDLETSSSDVTRVLSIVPRGERAEVRGTPLMHIEFLSLASQSYWSVSWPLASTIRSLVRCLNSIGFSPKACWESNHCGGVPGTSGVWILSSWREFGISVDTLVQMDNWDFLLTENLQSFVLSQMEKSPVFEWKQKAATFVGGLARHAAPPTDKDVTEIFQLFAELQQVAICTSEFDLTFDLVRRSECPDRLFTFRSERNMSSLLTRLYDWIGPRLSFGNALRVACGFAFDGFPEPSWKMANVD